MKSFLTVLVTGLVLSVIGYAAEPARPLTSKQAKQLMGNESTPADHARLAKYFEVKAEKLEEESKEHADMAKAYRAQPNASEIKRPGAADTAVHCEWLAKGLQEAANGARALAADHASLAKQ